MSLLVQSILLFAGIFITVVAIGASGFLDQIGAPTSSQASAASTKKEVTTAVIADLIPGPIGICSGGDRAARRVTCIVDGDTGWLKGEKWRLVAKTGGVDAPELSKPECAAEKAKASVARDRLRSLMSSGYAVERDGTDGYGRALVRITLADGRDAGDTLIAEGLAQEWPNTGNVWCDR